MRGEDKMATVFSVLSSLTVVAVMILYLRQTVKGGSTPNPATWLIWLVVGVMNTVSYFSVVQGNLVEWVMTPCAVLGTASIFFYALFKGKFGKVGIVEVVCFGLACVIGFFWKLYGPIAANISLQVIYIISFCPTAIGLLKGRLREEPLPWVLAIVSFAFQVGAILCNFTDDSWTKLVYPVVNGVIGNGSVAVLIILLRRRNNAM